MSLYGRRSIPYIVINIVSIVMAKGKRPVKESPPWGAESRLKEPAGREPGQQRARESPQQRAAETN